MKRTDECQHEGKVYFAHMDGFYCQECQDTFINGRWTKKYQTIDGKRVGFDEPEPEIPYSTQGLELSELFKKCLCSDEEGKAYIRIYQANETL